MLRDSCKIVQSLFENFQNQETCYNEMYTVFHYMLKISVEGVVDCHVLQKMLAFSIWYILNRMAFIIISLSHSSSPTKKTFTTLSASIQEIGKISTQIFDVDK